VESILAVVVLGREHPVIRAAKKLKCCRVLGMPCRDSPPESWSRVINSFSCPRKSSTPIMVVSNLLYPQTPEHMPGAATDNAVVNKIKISRVIFLKPLYFNRCVQCLKSLNRTRYLVR
jgi:hypothetical protein